MKTRRIMTSAGVDIPETSHKRLADLITAENDREIVATLLEMMRSASLTVRAPRTADGGNNYEEVPDWRARGWAALQLKEIKYGKATAQLNIDVSDTRRRPLSDEETRRALLQEWESIREIGDQTVRLMKQVIPMDPLRALPSPVGAGEGGELVDVEMPE